MLWGTQLSYASTGNKATVKKCEWQVPLTTSELCTAGYIDFWVKEMVYTAIGGVLKDVTDISGPKVSTTSTFTVNPITKENLDTLVREWFVYSPEASEWVDVTFDELEQSITIKSNFYNNVYVKLTLDNDGTVFVNGVSASYVTTIESPETTVTWGADLLEAKVCNYETLNSNSYIIKDSLITKKCLQSVSEYLAKAYMKNPFFNNGANGAYTIKNPAKPLTYDNIIPVYSFPIDKDYSMNNSVESFSNTVGQGYTKHFTYSVKGNDFTVKSKKYSTIKSTLTYKNKKYTVNKKVLTILDLEKFFGILNMRPITK